MYSNSTKIIIAAVLTSIILLSVFLPTPQKERKVALIVLDGGEYQVIDKLRSEGELGNFSKLESNGVRANLHSSRSFSPVSWTKMGTGLSEENVSVEGWSYTDDRGEKSRIESSAIKHRRFWSYLNQEGIKTGVYHWLITWPPEPVDGFMVSAYLSGDLESLSYPSNMRVSNQTLKDSLQGFQEFEAANRIIDEYYGMDVLVMGFHVSDKIQHNFWKFQFEDPSENNIYSDTLYRSYREADSIIGRLNDEYTVIVVSDHGFKNSSITYHADLDPLLRKAGLADFDVQSESTESYHKEYQNTTLSHINEETKVINESHYRVSLDYRTPENLDKGEVERRLKDLRYEDGSRLLKDVNFTGDKFEAYLYINTDQLNTPTYRKRYMHSAWTRGKIPVYDQSVNISYQGSTLKFWLGPEKNGDHPPGTDGIFYAAGRGIDNTGKTDLTVETQDIAPLMLYLNDVPIPRGMDGEVPREIFTEEYLERNPVRYSNQSLVKTGYDTGVNRTDESETRIKDRLDKLGYLRE